MINGAEIADIKRLISLQDRHHTALGETHNALKEISSDVANSVWNANTSEYTTAGTFGSFIQSKLLTVAKFIGLS